MSSAIWPMAAATFTSRPDYPIAMSKFNHCHGLCTWTGACDQPDHRPKPLLFSDQLPAMILLFGLLFLSDNCYSCSLSLSTSSSFSPVLVTSRALCNGANNVCQHLGHENHHIELTIVCRVEIYLSSFLVPLMSFC